MSAVGDAVEAMTRAEHFQGIVLLDEHPNLFDRHKMMKVIRTVAVVAGPVGKMDAGCGVVGLHADEPSPGDAHRLAIDNLRNVLLFMKIDPNPDRSSCIRAESHQRVYQVIGRTRQCIGFLFPMATALR